MAADGTESELPSITMEPNSIDSDDDAITKHPAYIVLRGYGKFRVEDKKQLLLPFADRTTPATHFFPQIMLDDESPASTLLSSIQYTAKPEGIKVKKGGSSWSAEVMASFILRLHTLLSHAMTVTEGKRYLPCKAVHTFMSKVDPVIKEAIAKKEADDMRTKKRSSQKKQIAGRRIQEEILFDASKREKQPCPGCNHHFNMVVVDRRDEMNQIKEEYKLVLERWERSRSKDKGKRP